ncbi:hypothetical protein [Flavobacterium sp.]|uniref:hypothetical protein n=1 Tax=Flavobacterium sp. TaxID=239 RepID=UPI003BBF65C5
MNDAHLHMLVNHFPIIGVILGLGILFTGVLIKNNSVKNTAYGLFIVTAVFAAFSIGTGDGAEAMVEDMPTVGKNIIHIHEEIAEKLAISLYLLGIISIIGIYFTIKKHSKAKLISFVAIVIAIIGVFLAQKTGTSGGEIRHTEIRDTNTLNVISQDEKIDRD